MLLINREKSRFFLWRFSESVHKAMLCKKWLWCFVYWVKQGHKAWIGAKYLMLALGQGCFDVFIVSLSVYFYRCHHQIVT
jgi:hypothetical protein